MCTVLVDGSLQRGDRGAGGRDLTARSTMPLSAAADRLRRKGPVGSDRSDAAPTRMSALDNSQFGAASLPSAFVLPPWGAKNSKFRTAVEAP